VAGSIPVGSLEPCRAGTCMPKQLFSDQGYCGSAYATVWVVYLFIDSRSVIDVLAIECLNRSNFFFCYGGYHIGQLLCIQATPQKWETHM